MQIDSDGYSSSVPKPWEEEVGFGDVLYEWMSRAPWLGISAAAHLILFLILALIPWHLLQREKSKAFVSKIVPEVVEPFEVKEPEKVEPLDEPETVDEPTLVDHDLPEDPTNEPSEDTPEGLQQDLFDAPDFEADSLNALIGLGPGATGKYGNRLSRGPGRGPGGGGGIEPAIKAGLEWLAAHQASDGSWDADGFDLECGSLGASICDGRGEAPHDVGLTGLALLAFMASGNTTLHGQHREVVARGVKWLKDQQDYDTGLLGDKIGHSYMYNHGIATLALTEAYYFSKSPVLRGPAQKAVNFITRARNPYGAWRYDAPPTGANDTSVTGWMVLALTSAKDAGLRIDPECLRGALSWFDEMTDKGTGRVGYDTIGSQSSRVDGVNAHYPAEKGEAMTAVALLCRFFLGQDPAEEELMVKHADLILKKLPEWDPDGFGCDMYYWYYGSYAMYQMGGQHWRKWSQAMKQAVVKSQRNDADYSGSWDPIGPWGYSGGRVYSTAVMTLCLQVYFRYTRVIGGR